MYFFYSSEYKIYLFHILNGGLTNYLNSNYYVKNIALLRNWENVVGMEWLYINSSKNEKKMQNVIENMLLILAGKYQLNSCNIWI